MLYGRPAEVWAYDSERGARPLHTFHEEDQGAEEQAPRAERVRPLRLSYYGGGHYDCLVDLSHPYPLLKSPPGRVEVAAMDRLKRRLASESALDVGAAYLQSSSTSSSLSRLDALLAAASGGVVVTPLDRRSAAAPDATLRTAGEATAALYATGATDEELLAAAVAQSEREESEREEREWEEQQLRLVDADQVARMQASSNGTLAGLPLTDAGMLVGGDDDEEAMLQLALLQSMQSGAGNEPLWPLPSSPARPPTAARPPRRKLSRVSADEDVDEDGALQAAIAASLRGHG